MPTSSNDLPSHLSPEAAARYLRKEQAEIQRLIDRGELPLEPEGIPLEKVLEHKVYDAIIPGRLPEFEIVEGRGSMDQRLPDGHCTDCGETGGVHYLGTELLDGSLEFYHLVHTEVEHYFRCDCGSRWKVLKFL